MVNQNASADKAASDTISREEAIQNLIAHYKSQHGQDFYLDSAVEYFADATGVGVRTIEAIPKGTVLLTVPNSERVSLLNVKDKALKRVLENVQAKYEAIQGQFVRGLGCLRDIYPSADIALAVLVLHELAVCKEYTQTWPTEEDFEKYCYPIWFAEYQSQEFQGLLKGTSTLELLERYDKALHLAFEQAVKPVLMANKPEKFLPPNKKQGDNNLGTNLWKAFCHASALVRSRSHESTQAEGQCEIIPLVDLTNGMPSYCADKINVQIHKGKRPGTTSLITTQDIGQGQEVILSYGDVHASHFAVRYGCFPSDILHNLQGSLESITLRIPTSLTPPDEMRARACSKVRLPSTQAMLQKWFVGLHYSTLESLRLGGEVPPQLQGLQTFLILGHLLDDNAVLRASTDGTIEGSWTPQKEGQLFLLVLDHNLTQITSLEASTNAQDLEKAEAAANQNDLVTAYHARICQRDTLAQWRHALCQRYQYESEPVVDAKRYQVFCSLLKAKGDCIDTLPMPAAPQCLMESGGCPISGRTFNLKACGRCKQVKYCCRDHQRLDWKLGHKKACQPPTS